MEPSALTTTWQLRFRPTLLSRDAAYQGYLGSIFTRVLKHGARWTQSWISEILSASRTFGLVRHAIANNSKTLCLLQNGAHPVIVFRPCPGWCICGYNDVVLEMA